MKKDRERGVVVVEASIIVTLVTLLITVMLYLGMVMYQKTVVSAMANQTASNLAQIYSNNQKDPFTGYIDADKVYQAVTYSNTKTDAYVDLIEQKANVFAKYRLKSSKMLKNEATAVDVQVVKKPNEILKSQIVVTITDTYDLPLVGMFGADGKIEFSASGRADCVDILEYLNGVQAVGDPENSAVQIIPDSDTCLVHFVIDKYSGDFHATVPVLKGETITTSNRYSHSKMPSNPKKGNLKFTGWKTSNGTSFSASTRVDNDMTVYGTWECKVTFDPTGGKVSPTSKAVSYKTATTFPTPTRSGYAFEGWYTGKDGAGSKYESGITEICENITLYAKWRCTHAAFDSKMLNAGDCKTRSTWRYDCKTCDYWYQKNGDYGKCVSGGRTEIGASCTQSGSYIENCKLCGKTMRDANGNAISGTIPALGHRYANGSSGAYDQPIHRDATCQREGIDGSRCSRCGAEQGTVLGRTDHVWGYCGKLHTSKSYTFTFKPATGHYNGTHVTNKYYCIVCVHCRTLRGGEDPYNNTAPRDGTRPVSDLKWCGVCNIGSKYQEVPIH